MSSNNVKKGNFLELKNDNNLGCKYLILKSYRSLSKSHLFPAIAIQISFPTIFRSSFTHFVTLLKDSASVISYTKSAPSNSVINKLIKN